MNMCSVYETDKMNFGVPLLYVEIYEYILTCPFISSFHEEFILLWLFLLAKITTFVQQQCRVSYVGIDNMDIF
jgi:hypothetical protein